MRELLACNHARRGGLRRGVRDKPSPAREFQRQNDIFPLSLPSYRLLFPAEGLLPIGPISPTYRDCSLIKMTFDAFSPREVIEAISKSGAQKGNMRLDKVLFSAVSAGCLLAFACGTTLSTTAAPWFQDNAPGLIRTIGALVFPYGLCMILLTSADLCTGSFMV